MQALRWMWISLIVLVAGCAHWSPEQAGEAQQILPPPKLAPDAVVIDAVLIRFPEEQAAALNEIWRVVDESVVPLATRRELNANGVQCGMLVGEMPRVVRARLKELAADHPGNSLERIGLAAEISSDTQRLHCHAGHRKELTLRPGMLDQLTILHIRDGRIEGNTYAQPRILLDLRASPLGDGRARLKIVPEIQHGQPQEILLSNAQMTAVKGDVRRQQQRFEYLAMETTIGQGQFFLCTLADPPRGLGQAMFSTRTSERTTERVLLVIRLIANQLDDLFAPDEVEAARHAAEQ